MQRLRTLLFALSMLTLLGGSAQAVEVLQNGNLNDPGIHENDAIANWTLTELGGAVNTPQQNTATFASFADHTSPADPDPGVGLWLRAFEGLFYGNSNEPSDAILTQIVPGTPGNKYTFTGWSRWEGGYSGGVTTLDPGSPSGAVPSPTGTFMEMRFLDAANAGISGVLLDLRSVQQNDNTWRQHMLMETAPAGTASVLVTAYTLDMVPNVNIAPGGQSAFFDDFSLDNGVIPEPTTAALGLFGILGMFGLVRRR